MEMTSQLLSSDSHMCEPPDLWLKRLPSRLRERAPRVVRGLNGKPGDWFCCEDAFPRAVFNAFAAGVPSDQLKQRSVAGFDAAPECVWDPAARVRDQDEDGVAGEVLYPTFTDIVFATNDGDLRRACFAVYNDFVAEYCSHDPGRLIGIGVIDTEQVDYAVSELERCRKMGLRGVTLRADPPPGQAYGDRKFDDFWGAATDAKIPISIHRGSVRRDVADDVVSAITDYALIPHQIQKTLAALLLGGLWERFPTLKVVCCEFDLSWIPHFMGRLEYGYQKFGRAFGLDYAHSPAEQMRRSVVFSFQHEVDDVKTLIDVLGPRSMMWSSDYPHSDSTWPNSKDAVRELTERLPAPVVAACVHHVCADLYRIADASPRPPAAP